VEPSYISIQVIRCQCTYTTDWIHISINSIRLWVSSIPTFLPLISSIFSNKIIGSVVVCVCVRACVRACVRSCLLPLVTSTVDLVGCELEYIRYNSRYSNGLNIRGSIPAGAAFFSERLYNHCHGLRRNFSEICTKLDAVPLSNPSRNRINPDTGLQIKECKKSARPPSCVKYCTVTHKILVR
jgi:hypothetical protein